MAHGSTFAQQLRAEIARQRLSIKKLGARYRPDDPEGGRRALHKYLAGDHFPNPRTRAAIGAAFPEPVDFDQDLEPVA